MLFTNCVVSRRPCLGELSPPLNVCASINAHSQRHNVNLIGNGQNWSNRRKSSSQTSRKAQRLVRWYVVQILHGTNTNLDLRMLVKLWQRISFGRDAMFRSSIKCVHNFKLWASGYRH